MSNTPEHPATRAPVLVTMADDIPGREVEAVIGIARGSVVRDFLDVILWPDCAIWSGAKSASTPS